MNTSHFAVAGRCESSISISLKADIILVLSAIENSTCSAMRNRHTTRMLLMRWWNGSECVIGWFWTTCSKHKNFVSEVLWHAMIRNTWNLAWSDPTQLDKNYHNFTRFSLTQPYQIFSLRGLIRRNLTWRIAAVINLPDLTRLESFIAQLANLLWSDQGKYVLLKAFVFNPGLVSSK